MTAAKKPKTVEVWMPFMVDKYLGDTTNLTTEMHGAYVLLLLTMWKRDGQLPNDDVQLAAIAKLSPARWRSYRPVLIDSGHFFVVDGTRLRQKRLEEELERAKNNLAQRTKAGVASGEARKARGEGATEGATDVGTDVADSLAKNDENGQRNSRPIPLPSSLRSEERDTAAIAAGAQPAAEPASTVVVLDEGMPPCPHQAILAAFHEAMPMARRPKAWGAPRQTKLRARWREDRKRQSLEWWRGFFEHCAKSGFLTGKRYTPTKAPFEISLDWLVTSSHFLDALEGKYHRAEDLEVAA